MPSRYPPSTHVAVIVSAATQKRHRTSRDDEIGGRPVADPARGEPADRHEGRDMATTAAIAGVTPLVYGDMRPWSGTERPL